MGKPSGATYCSWVCSIAPRFKTCSGIVENGDKLYCSYHQLVWEHLEEEKHANASDS